MTEHEDRVLGPENDTVPQPAAETAAPAEPAADVSANGTAEHAELNGAGEHRWHAEAGRKGAHRIHQLIEAGKRYEQEHGLKSGRQRLRQLIELGKVYEQEHGLRPAERRRGKRLSRMDREQTLSTLLDCLLRIAKPSFRPELRRLAEALRVEDTNRAA